MTTRRRAAALALAVAVLVPLAAGCAKPAYTYVADQDTKTYYKVPSGWTKVETATTDGVFAQHILQLPSDTQVAFEYHKVMRSSMFDASSEPSQYSMVTLTETADPVIYSLVAPAPSDMRQVMSLNLMRDFFFPVTAEARRTFAESHEDGLPDFELLDDEVLTPAKGLRGVRVVYNYRLESRVLHTFDLTVLTDDASSTVYLLLVRCTASCYRKRAVELNGIVTSFTVRST